MDIRHKESVIRRVLENDGMVQEKKMPKCRKRLINAFIELRSRKPLEKISVVELVARADVNKSTFYAYFHDVYDLSEQLQQELIDRIAETLPHPENVILNTAQYTKDVLLAYEANKQQIAILFSGGQSWRLPMLVRNKTMEIIHEHISDSGIDEEKLSMIVNYKIYGAYYAYASESRMDIMDKIEYISRLTGGEIGDYAEFYKGKC